MRPWQTLLWHLINQSDFSICRKHSPLLRRWSWRFSSNREVNSSFCLTTSAISSSFSSESGISFFFFFKQEPVNKNTVSVNHLCTPGGAKKVFSESWSHLLPRFSPSPDSTHQIYWFPASPRNWIHPPPSQGFSPATPEKNSPKFYHIYTIFSSICAYPEQDTANRMTKMQRYSIE